MKIIFTPRPGVKVIEYDSDVIIKPPNNNGQVGPEVKRNGEPDQNSEQAGDEGREKGRIGPAMVRQILAGLKTDPEEIEDEQQAEDYRKLLQLVEALNEDNEKLRADRQELRDTLNVLLGEQGQPKIKANKKKKDEEDDGDVSSEKERKKRKPPTAKKSKAKKHKIKIDRTQICPVDKSSLPEDAQFKGYRSVIVQEIIIKTDNVEYQKEVYYSPSQNKTYTGQLPAEIKGEFGPGLKTLVYTQKHVANMSEPKIEEFLKTMGVYISPATISRILTKNNELFHQEKADIFQAGLTSSRYQQIDDTSAKVNGQNQYMQIVSNTCYAAYFTIPRKDRLSVLAILNGGQVNSYLFNEEAFQLLACFGLSKKLRVQLRELAFDKEFDQEQLEALLKQVYPEPEQGKNNRLRIKEAGGHCDLPSAKRVPGDRGSLER